MTQIKDKELRTLDEVTVRFAGDSGDGMQLTGSQFSDTAATLGNDLSTLPDYPAEIRAPVNPYFDLNFGIVSFFPCPQSQMLLAILSPLFSLDLLT